MGSTTAEAAGACQYSAKVVHSAIMPAPVAAAMASASPSAMRLRTGSTGSFSGCPLMRMLPNSPRRGGFSARNAPYSTTKVTAAKAQKTTACALSVVQNTAA